MKLLILAIAIVFIAFTSCHKPFEPAVVKVTTNDTTYNLRNESMRDLYATLYNSYQDMVSLTNPMYSCVVAADSVYKIPLSQLNTTVGTPYFFHITTADGLYSNWGSRIYFTPSSYSPSARNIIISNFLVTQAAWYFMRGNASTITWVAVDKKYSNNQSLWSTLDDNGRFFKVTINRDYSGDITRKQSGGALQESQFDVVEADSAVNGNTILNFVKGGTYLSYRMHNTTLINDRRNRDTIVVEDQPYYWFVVPQ